MVRPERRSSEMPSRKVRLWTCPTRMLKGYGEPQSEACISMRITAQVPCPADKASNVEAWIPIMNLIFPKLHCFDSRTRTSLVIVSVVDISTFAITSPNQENHMCSIPSGATKFPVTSTTHVHNNPRPLQVRSEPCISNIQQSGIPPETGTHSAAHT